MKDKKVKIDVWYTLPEQIGSDILKAYCSLLTQEERERERKFAFVQDRHHFRITRALVRIVLSKYAPLAPEEWSFTVGSHGKPEIANALATPLTFNVAHSAKLIVVAVSGNKIGVDTENIHSRDADEDIVRRYFTGKEEREFHTLPSALRPARFFELWTLKEAYIKARGLGLSIPLNQIGFSLCSENGIRAWSHPDQNDRIADWNFWQFWIPDGNVVSLCARKEEATVSVFRSVPLVSEFPVPYDLSRWSRDESP